MSALPVACSNHISILWMNAWLIDATNHTKIASFNQIHWTRRSMNADWFYSLNIMNRFSLKLLLLAIQIWNIYTYIYMNQNIEYIISTGYSTVRMAQLDGSLFFLAVHRWLNRKNIGQIPWTLCINKEWANHYWID